MTKRKQKTNRKWNQSFRPSDKDTAPQWNRSDVLQAIKQTYEEAKSGVVSPEYVHAVIPLLSLALQVI